MSLSTSKKTTKSEQQATNTVAPSDYSAPFVSDAAAKLQPGFDAASANNTALQGRVNGALDASSDYYTSVLNGDYLKGNPHLQGVLDSTNRDITSGVNSNFEGAGRYGSNYHADAIARALAENEDKLRYGDYATERANQGAAASALPNITATSAGISSLLPQQAGATYAQQIAQLLGRYTTGNASSSGTSVEKSTPSIMDYLMQMEANAAKAAAAGGG